MLSSLKGAVTPVSLRSLKASHITKRLPAPLRSMVKKVSVEAASMDTIVIKTSHHTFKAQIFKKGRSTRYYSRISQDQAEMMSEYNRVAQDYHENKVPHSVSLTIWLLINIVLIIAMMLLGGVTRLTESGLSITEWKPVTGAIPPMDEEAWEEEFRKYKEHPEFKRLNPYMNLSEFKRIYTYEWAHRLLGRVIGVTMAAPLLYFAVNKMMPGWLFGRMLAFTGLIGAQGALGWYMVKSGLEVTPEEVPRVSPYRLCAHLLSAIGIYAGMVWTLMDLIRPTVAVTTPIPYRVRYLAGGLLTMVLATVTSGAFVAGLDAGLVYNEFPKMGEGYVPEEYSRMQPFWKNMFENDAAVQFNHRLVAICTFIAINLVYILNFRMIEKLPRGLNHGFRGLVGMSWVQVALGITALLTFVPVPVASAHQAMALGMTTVGLSALHVSRRKQIKVPLPALK